MNTSNKPSYMIQSVCRALEIVKLFLPRNLPLTQNDISKITGLNKSTVLRMVYTLVNEGFLKQQENGRGFVIGVDAMRVGLCALNSLNLVKVADPILQHLSDESGFLVHLAVCENNSNSVFVVAKYFPCNSRLVLHLQSTVGGVLPIYCTGIGRLFLSQKSDDEVFQILNNCELIPYTPLTITNISQIMERVKETRRVGMEINDGESEDGIVGISFPIFDRSKKMVAGISIAGIREVIFRSDFEKLKNVAKIASLNISHEIGYYT